MTDCIENMNNGIYLNYLRTYLI